MDIFPILCTYQWDDGKWRLRCSNCWSSWEIDSHNLESKKGIITKRYHYAPPRYCSSCGKKFGDFMYEYIYRRENHQGVAPYEI